jgi:hypothetical protein
MGSNAGARIRPDTNTNSIDISNHSVSMTLMEPSDSVVIRGHNCKIEIGAGNTITHLVITGHNNKVYSKSGGSSSSSGGTSQVGVVDTVEVMGHNNRLENIIANNVNVRGHNNRLNHIACSSVHNISDSGICNQFQNIVQQ